VYVKLIDKFEDPVVICNGTQTLQNGIFYVALGKQKICFLKQISNL
jgi:hypothetical protein